MEYDALKKGYTNLFKQMIVRPEKIEEATRICTILIKYKERYENPFKIPWYFIAILHMREAGLNEHDEPRFDRYLGNGQCLNAVTTVTPVGRGPFDSFEKGVIDALQEMGYDKIIDFSVEHMLYLFEKFNGFSYFGKINSPYLYAGSNLYTVGKFDRDGHYVASLMDQQLGCAVLLRTMLRMLNMIDTAPALPTDTTPALPPPAPVNTVTTDQLTNLIHHMLTAVGAIIAGLGFSHISSLWDFFTNSQVFGGAIIGGLGYLLSAIGIRVTNNNTVNLIDSITTWVTTKFSSAK